MYNMTNEQIERYLKILEQKNEALENISSSLDDVSSSISSAYNGTETSAFWAMSQALFSMVDSDRNGDGLRVIVKNNDR